MILSNTAHAGIDESLSVYALIQPSPSTFNIALDIESRKLHMYNAHADTAASKAKGADNHFLDDLDRKRHQMHSLDSSSM